MEADTVVFECPETRRRFRSKNFVALGSNPIINVGTEGSSKPTRQLYIFPTLSVKGTRYTDSMPDANFLWPLAPNGLNI